MDTVKVNWSGGKDSTCALSLHLDRGDKVIGVCYIPMFTDEIPLLLEDHYEHILRTADRFREMGAEIYIVSGMTYYDYCKKRSTRGKFKGVAFGFPSVIPGRCHFKDYSKIKAVGGFAAQYDYVDMGIAADEVKRHSQLNSRYRSILVEVGYTEAMALQYCKERTLLSPHYGKYKRDGCALCPHASTAERKQWISEYPQAIPILIELQEFVKTERPDRVPLRGYKWFIEDDGTIN